MHKSIKWLALILIAVIMAGCAHTSTGGNYNPTTGEMQVKSSTTFFGAAAGKTAKQIEFKIVNDKLVVEAKGSASAEAQTSFDGLDAIVRAAVEAAIRAAQ